MAGRIITNRTSLAGSAARDAEARRVGEPQQRSGGMGFSMRGQGGRTGSMPVPSDAPAVATNKVFPGRQRRDEGVGLPSPIEKQAAYPAHMRPTGEVTSAVSRIKQMFRTWFK